MVRFCTCISVAHCKYVGLFAIEQKDTRISQNRGKK